MCKYSTVGIVLLSLIAFSQPPLARAAQQDDTFDPVEALTVSPVTASDLSVADGTVVLRVFVSKDGTVHDINVEHALASVTKSTVDSVRAWTFKPATMRGRPIASVITVVGVFNNECVFTPAPKSPISHPGEPSDVASGFQPADVLFANLPICPLGGGPILSASIVIEAGIGAAGTLKSMHVLRDTAPFTAPAAQSLKDWKFTPARLNGTAIESKVILAFFIHQLAPTNR